MASLDGRVAERPINENSQANRESDLADCGGPRRFLLTCVDYCYYFSALYDYP